MQDIERICELGRAVIGTEVDMLKLLLDRVNQSFANACQTILACKGRLVVMGMGKSGHIAKKLAATFASTGTPAFFIHPGEAKHGDFGMITAQDVVIIISYSGETEEILAIIPFIKRLNVPLIALCGKINSTLGSASNLFIDVSITQEACPLGLAPTCSTTAALVMGDALAIALLQMRGFTADDFARSHPGGTLGRRLLLSVQDIMHTAAAIPKVNPDDLIKKALFEITEKKLGLTTVIDENNILMGIFTDGDIRRALDKNADIQNTRVKEMMTGTPKVIPPHTLAVEALNIMQNLKITSLIVTNPTKEPIGVVHLHDILRAGVV
jgi:arabinose-5-phosphate isomerase